MQGTIQRRRSDDPGNLRPRRLASIASLGLAAILVSLAVRSTPWARERYYRSLSAEELAYVIHDRPRDPLAFLYYGSALMGMGNSRGSVGAFKRAVALDPKLARAHSGAGSAFLREGRLPQALSAFQMAVELSPKDPVAQLGLAQTYYRMGSPKRAIPALQEVVRRDPRRAIAWYYLGKMYGDARQSDEALKALQKAVELNPEEAAYWRDLSQLSRHYSRFQEAESQLRQALRLNPKDPLTCYWLGQLLGKMGRERLAEAERHLKEAARLDPLLMEPHFELGQIAERRGDLTQAIHHYRKARSIAPDSARPLYQLGTCLIRAGRPQDGERLIKAFEQLTTAKQEIEGMENRSRSDPMNPDLHLRLARIYLKYEHFDGALEQYDIYLQLNPGQPAVMAERDRCARRRAAESAGA